MSSPKKLYDKWHTAISELDLERRRTCILFNKQHGLQQVPLLQQQNDKCSCGRLKRSHSYEGASKSEINDNWNLRSCSALIEDTKNFGILYNPYESCLTKVKRIYFLFVDEHFSFHLVYSL